MSVHLVGGGWPADGDTAVFSRFIVEAAHRAASAGRAEPRIAVVAVRDGDAEAHAAKLVEVAAAVGAFVPVVTAVAHGGDVPPSAFADVDGVIVGGGNTPAYRDALEPRFGELRRLVAAGTPYLGFSAGAMIAAERALIGGRAIGGVTVSPESGDQGLDEVTVAPGIGLVDVAIDVHVAQWGALSRLVAAVEAGIAEGGLGIDEETVLIVGEGGLEVQGRGSVWRVLPAEHGVVVSTIGA
ncbi:Type 1 glutamine amidotransferase-like domain-containing protein [Agromyces sp. H3Y2-19a]|uniref:Type 1 glutamine amidotransferase-like domain-containing protein n=1 Tax=Agromyces TaxID=33877 RepID=UPI001E3845FD|nr:MULTISPECIES: Type 1 glutamine amidotransferase-like domain-containing protein [Agromyces]MCD5347693.1 Type 1 glutamine amidotransferase-like domain-containing protein [Agromyces sp. S2-1-8]MDF0514736.1 Type 1 glutamine amidotransferase-like domain-containing protein [Agromyces chromiiresistens]